jgi:hypothetical protein
MLTERLRQIKSRIQEKPIGTRTKEEAELFLELRFLEENEEIQREIRLRGNKLLEMIAPAPDNCPACGRKF